MADGTAVGAARSRGDCAASSTRAQEGDRDALEELYLLHFDRIYSYLHVSVGNRHDAEDLTTQTFLRMLESIGRFRWQSAPSRHGCSGSRTTSRSTTSGLGAVQPEDEVPEPPTRRSPRRSSRRSDSIGQAGMLELIERLSSEQRQVLTLKFLFGFGNAETARSSARPRAP